MKKTVKKVFITMIWMIEDRVKYLLIISANREYIKVNLVFKKL